MTGPHSPRVLVVDDDLRFVQAVTALLEAGGIEVVGHASNGAAAVREVEHLEPDVVTLDIDMPIMDGVEATKAIAPLGIPIVILGGSDSSERIGGAIAAGGRASVVKSEAAHLLVPLLKAIVDA